MFNATEMIVVIKQKTEQKSIGGFQSRAQLNQQRNDQLIIHLGSTNASVPILCSIGSIRKVLLQRTKNDGYYQLK